MAGELLASEEGVVQTAGPDVGSHVSGARLVRNSAINGIAITGGMVVTILLTPYMLDRLGSVSFGIWALAITLTATAGYLSLTDLGLQQASVRFMADARRGRDPAQLTGIFSTTVAIFLVVSVVVAGLMVALAPAIASIFSVQGAVRHAAIVTFAIVGAQIVFDLPGLAYRAVLESAQRYGAIRVIELVRAILFAGLVVGVLSIGRGVVAIASCSAASAAAALSAYVVVVRTSEAAARLRPSSIQRHVLRELLGFSRSLFLLRILSVSYRQMDKLIVGAILSVSAVATYEVANRVQAAMFLLLGIGGSALLPAATLSRVDKPRMRDLFLRATSYSVALFLPVSIAVLVYARLVVVGWVGAQQAGATGAVRLFALWVALGTFDAAGTTMLVAVGRLRPVVALSVVWVASNLVLSLILVHVWGITGVVAATVITYAPLLVAYTTLCLDEFRISLGDWARRVLIPNLPGPAVQVVLSLATLHEVERLPPLAGAALGGGIGTAVSLGLFFFIGLRRPERRYVREVLTRASGRPPTEVVSSRR